LEADFERAESPSSDTYPLRFPQSLKAAVEKIAKEEGVSLNQFVARAVAEKLTAMSTANLS
jgi:predicted HicB family RNase H-like nuclease